MRFQPIALAADGHPCSRFLRQAQTIFLVIKFQASVGGV